MMTTIGRTIPKATTIPAPGTKSRFGWPVAGTSGVERVMVTPEMALGWTERPYPQQRPVNENHVRFLMNQITKGLWSYDASTIVFDRSGRLIDGQHRCHAIVGSGVAVEALIVWGVEEEAYKTKDTGRIRTAGDLVKCEHAHNVATCARSIVAFRDSGIPVTSGRGNRVSNSEILTAIEEDPSIVEAVAFIMSLPELRSLMSPATAAFGYYLMRQVDQAAAEEFWKTVASGAGLSEGDARLALIRFSRNSGVRSSGTKARTALMAVVIKAWNFWRAGKTVALLRYSVAEEFPKPI